MDSAALRQHFLVERIFTPNKVTLTYSHIDRIIVGGASPTNSRLAFPQDAAKTLAAAHFLERREMGIINVGGAGKVYVGGQEISLDRHEGLYIGADQELEGFISDTAGDPAKFYFNAAPAHKSYPLRKITLADASPTPLGKDETCNKRTIYKYLHPDVLKSCQLSMGLTKLEAGSNWNTMPPHTHDRRMEVYFYFDMPEDGSVFHIMGEPDETRHIIVRNEQAVINPSWSLHCGVGTRNYTFIWGMVGENKVFDDMDHLKVENLR